MDTTNVLDQKKIKFLPGSKVFVVTIGSSIKIFLIRFWCWMC